MGSDSFSITVLLFIPGNGHGVSSRGEVIWNLVSRSDVHFKRGVAILGEPHGTQGKSLPGQCRETLGSFGKVVGDSLLIFKTPEKRDGLHATFERRTRINGKTLRMARF